MTVPAQKLERLYVSSPIRRYVHQPLITHWLVKCLKEINAPAPQRILEIGCGTGAGLIGLRRAFPDAEIMGIEIDEAMAKIAQKRGELIQAKVFHGSATDTTLREACGTCDMVVSYGCIHHIPAWEEMIQAIYGLLNESGFFFAEEYYKPLLEHPLFQYVGHHPPERFTHSTFLEICSTSGLRAIADKNTFNICGLSLLKK